MKILRRVAAAVLIVCLCALGFIVWTYVHQANEYSELAKSVESDSSDGAKLASMKIDWDALKKENPDVVAWVKMPGTKIDYPVVKGEDNEEYLHTSFSGDTGWAASAGTIFVDSKCADDLSNDNVVLFGHHMRDGSMFAQVAKLASQTEFDKHRTFYVLTPTMNYEVTTVGCALVKGSDSVVKFDFLSNKKHGAYLRKLCSKGNVSTNDVSLKSVEKSFCLATCEYSQSDGRAMLVGVVTDEAKPK